MACNYIKSNVRIVCELTTINFVAKALIFINKYE